MDGTGMAELRPALGAATRWTVARIVLTAQVLGLRCPRWLGFVRLRVLRRRLMRRSGRRRPEAQLPGLACVAAAAGLAECLGEEAGWMP